MKNIYVLAIPAMVALLCSSCSKKETEKALDRAQVIAEEATDSVLSAMEKRVGLSRIAIRNLDKEKARRREALINIRAKQKELERKSDEENRLAITASEGKAEKHKAKAEMFKAEAARAEETYRRAEKNYKAYCDSIVQRKEDLQLAEMKLEVLKAELDAMGKGDDASNHAEQARKIEEELKKTCDRMEAKIDIAEIDDI